MNNAIVKSIKKYEIFIIIALAIIILPVSGVSIGNNSAKYLHQSSQLIKGEPVTMILPDRDIARGLGYPCLLAAGFTLFGREIFIASLLTRLFFSLILIMAFVIGKKMFGRTTGYLFAVMILSSYHMNLFSLYLDTDILMPFFLLLFILFYYLAEDRSVFFYSFMAGITMSVAYFVKETAIFFLLIPMGCIFFDKKEKRLKNIRIFFTILAVNIITLLPWAYYVYSYYGELSPILGVFSPKFLSFVAQNEGTTSIFSYMIHIVRTGIYDVVRKLYSGDTDVRYLVVLIFGGSAFVAYGIRAIKERSKEDLIVLFGVIAYIPIAVRVMVLGLRFGQLLMLICMLYLLIARIIVIGIFRWMPIIEERMGINQKRIMGLTDNQRTFAIYFTFLAVILSVQLWGPLETMDIWKDNQMGLYIMHWNGFEVHRRFTTDQKKAAEWLAQNVGESVYMADGFIHEALEFFSNTSRSIPIFHPVHPVDLDDEFPRGENKPLYIFTYSKFLKNNDLYKLLYIVFDEDIYKALNQYKTEYVVISNVGRFYGEYFKKAEWASLEYENDTVMIYALDLDDYKPVYFNTVGINKYFSKHIEWLKDEMSLRYHELEKEIERYGLSFDDLFNSELQFEENMIY